MARADSRLVLVVDDDAELRAVVCDLLETNGLRTITASDGEGALAAARQHRPDLIVLDIVMQGMDGYTALTHLHGDAATREIPVIVLTGRAEEIYRILSVGGGAVAHVTKPFEPGALLATVRDVLRLS